jgi:hypothetical protein
MMERRAAACCPAHDTHFVVSHAPTQHAPMFDPMTRLQVYMGVDPTWVAMTPTIPASESAGRALRADVSFGCRHLQ